MATGKDSEPQEVQALVIDSNATSRSILVAQLREYGVTKVVQCSRVWPEWLDSVKYCSHST